MKITKDDLISYIKQKEMKLLDWLIIFIVIIIPVGAIPLFFLYFGKDFSDYFKTKNNSNKQ